jgi:hypothetical protein
MQVMLNGILFIKLTQMEPNFFQKTERKHKLKIDFKDQRKSQILNEIN